jgi:hypothetical protein
MLWVHVAADFNAIVSKQRKIQSGSSGISKKRIKSRLPLPPAIFAQVFIVKVLSLTSRVLPVLWDLRSDAFILAPAITVPKAGRLALSTIDTALPIGGFQRSQFGYAKAEAMDTL